MAQFNSLLVTGDSRFLNPINGNARNGVYTVIGTQTASTGSWTGNIPIPALYDGLSIDYYLPYDGSGNATLNLTLSDGTTTGAKNCYITTGRLTTHYGAGRVIHMTYWSAGSISIKGTATTDDRWICDAYYDTNDGSYYTRRNYSCIKTGPNKIFPYTIIMQNSDGRWESIVTSSSTGTSKARNTHGFRLGKVLTMYANATYAENAIVDRYNIYEFYGSLVDHRYSFNTANNATSGTTANMSIYLVGAINASDGLFYLSPTWWTQTLPSTDDGKLYIYIGDAYDYYRMVLASNHPIYCYKNGKVREFAQDADTLNGLSSDDLLPVSTATSGIGTSAKFTTDYALPLVSAKFGMIATQSGSGTPTPSNIRAINGYSSLSISRSSTSPMGWIVTLPSTIYHGEVDAVNGKVLSTSVHYKVSDLTWTYDSTYTRMQSSTISGTLSALTRQLDFMCSHYQVISDGRAIGNVPNLSAYWGGAVSPYIYVKDTNYTNANTWKSAMANCEFVLPLAIPVEYTNISTEITSDVGDNTFSGGGGGVITIAYRHEPRGDIIVSGTLIAGQTSLTLVSNSITTSSTFEFFTDKFGVVPTRATVSAGSIVLTFTAQSSNVGVKVKVT